MSAIALCSAVSHKARPACAVKRAPVTVVASTIFAALLAGCPDRPLDRARALEEKGDLREAGELYVDAAKADPANLAAWDAAIELWCRKSFNVGECMGVLDLELKLLGNVERHKEALSEVLELRARARSEQGLIDAALSDLDRAQRAMPNRSTVYSARARALLKQGLREEALTALKRARELDRKNAEVDELAKAIAEKKTAEKPKAGEEKFGGQ